MWSCTALPGNASALMVPSPSLLSLDKADCKEIGAWEQGGVVWPILRGAQGHTGAEHCGLSDSREGSGETEGRDFHVGLSGGYEGSVEETQMVHQVFEE